MSINRINALFIGNPGTGKSTLLNSLIRQVLFKSGVSLGRGLTQILQVEMDQYGNKWIDTPGLQDIEMRQKAATEIENALKQTGTYKVIFVFTLESGRVRPADLTTMTLVLNACPVIKNNFSIIVNKVSKGVFREIDKSVDNMNLLIASLQTGVPMVTKSIYFYEEDAEARDENNYVMDLSKEFINFFYECPSIYIEPEDVNEIQLSEYETIIHNLERQLSEMNNRNELLQAEINLQREIFNQIQEQNKIELERIRNENINQINEMNRRNEEANKSLSNQIENIKKRK